MDDLQNIHPLKIYEISQEEKFLLVDLLKLASSSGVINLKSLESQLDKELSNRGITKTSLRYLMKYRIPEHQENEKRNSDAIYAKWVFLYNFVMGELLTRCEGPHLSSLRTKLRQLYDLGVESHRYDTDMHIFNRYHLYYDTGITFIDERYYDVYVGFRYDSKGQDIIRTIMKIGHEYNRDIFRLRIINEAFPRQTRGFAYQLEAHLYLSGFLNENQGFESYALRADDINHDILFGIMTTTDRNGVAHAKPCCFIRCAVIRNLDYSNIEVIAEFRKSLDKCLPNKLIINISGARSVIDLRRYLSKESTRALNSDDYLAAPERW